MAFDVQSFSRHGGTTPAPSWWTYQTSDSWDTVLSTDYFNLAYTSVNVDDFILVRASVNTFMCRVTAVLARSVTVIREDLVAATGIGSGIFGSNVDVVAASPNTAYQVPFNFSIAAGGIKLNASNNTKIEFSESGTYLITGNIQLLSNSASSKTFYLYPTINGSQAASKTIRTTIKDNSAYLSVAVSSSLVLSAGDYIQANYAVTDVDAWMDASSATAFAPGSNAIQISVIKI